VHLSPLGGSVSNFLTSIDDFPSSEFATNRFKEGARLSAQKRLLLELRFQVETTKASGKTKHSKKIGL